MYKDLILTLIINMITKLKKIYQDLETVSNLETVGFCFLDNLNRFRIDKK